MHKRLRERLEGNALIGACEKGKQPERALGVIQAMQRLGLLTDVTAYTCAMDACEKGSQTEQALTLFQMLQRQGVLPNMVTYVALVGACANGKQP